MSGYYRMHRGWQSHPVFRNEEYSRRDAFVWLIEEAAFKTTKVFVGTGEITIERGQLSHSLRYMAKAWKWDDARVRRFLSSLSKSKIIDTASDAGQTVITICNYEKYQAVQRAPDAAPDAAATQQRRGGDAKKKEDNKISNDTRAYERTPEEVDLSKKLMTVCNAAKMTSPPRDFDRLKYWIDQGADFEKDILPTVSEMTERELDRGDTPRTFKLFDHMIMTKVEVRKHADQKYLDDHEKFMARYKDMPPSPVFRNYGDEETIQ